MEERRRDLEAQQFKRMTETPVNKLIIALAIPTIISMLVTGIYNTADTYFVSQINKSASGAVSVVFSLSALIQAIGFTFGMGGASIVSRALGRRDYKEANKISSSAFFGALFVGIIMLILGTIFIEPFMSLLGATETILPYAVDYGRYIIFAIPFMATSFVLNVLLRSQGKAKFSMIGLTFGGVLNIALDPLFIFALNMGIAGAALATAISQFISFAILLSFFLRKKSITVISLKKCSTHFKDYFDIIKTGFPSFLRQGLTTFATILLNKQAGVFGDAAISAMGIVTKIFMMIFCVVLGIGQGYQPVVGYNYSAKKYGRLKEAAIFTWIAGTIGMSVLAIVAFIISPSIIKAFINDPEVIDIGSATLRAQSIALIFVATGVVCNMTFQSIGKKFLASLFASFRQGLFFIPLLLILPNAMGVVGVEYAQAIADILTFAVSLPALIYYLRTLSKKQKEIDVNEAIQG